MSRDYARKSKPASGGRIPGWVWLFTAVVSCGFVGFLFFLSHVPEENTNIETLSKQLAESLKDLETNTAPEATENYESLDEIKDKADTLKRAFEFYELLENDEVPISLPNEVDGLTLPDNDAAEVSPAIPQTQSNLPETGAWMIQVASFNSVADADQVRAQLILNGLPNTEIVSVEVADKGTFHRIMVGPFSIRSDLDRARTILAELNFQPLIKTL